MAERIFISREIMGDGQMSVRTRAWGTLTGLLLIHLGAVVWWIASASDAANLQVQWTFALLVALLRDRGGEGCDRIRFSSAILNSLAISRTDASGTTLTTSVVMTSAAVNMASSHGFAREWPPPRHVRARATLPGGRLEREPIPYALETDWPVGAGGFEPLHFQNRTLSLGGGIRTSASGNQIRCTRCRAKRAFDAVRWSPETFANKALPDHFRIECRGSNPPAPARQSGLHQLIAELGDASAPLVR